MARTPGQAEDPLRIVGLGDSFSSGEGTGSYAPGTDTAKNRCHRSINSWVIIAGATPTDLLACSGATVDDLLAGQTGAPDNSGQGTRLSFLNQKRPVDVATVTIGGNDIGFSRILGACFALECLKQPAKERRIVDRVAHDLAEVGYVGLRKAAPGTRIIAVGYPRLFPAAGQRTVGCGWLEPQEQARANELARYIDERFAAAARRAKIEYVSTLDVLAGHELCTPDSWMQPVRVRCKFGDQQCAHPTRQGQEAIAQRVRPQIDAPVEVPTPEELVVSDDQGYRLGMVMTGVRFDHTNDPPGFTTAYIKIRVRNLLPDRRSYIDAVAVTERLNIGTRVKGPCPTQTSVYYFLDTTAVSQPLIDGYCVHLGGSCCVNVTGDATVPGGSQTAELTSRVPEGSVKRADLAAFMFDPQFTVAGSLTGDQAQHLDLFDRIPRR